MLNEAEDYFNKRLWTDEWDNASDSKKETALAHAQREIDTLGFSQKLDTEDYKRAIFEQTIFLINLKDEDLKRINLQSQGVTQININQAISETYVLNGIAYAPFIKQIQQKYNYQVGDLIW